jgi:hypothetical protein
VEEDRLISNLSKWKKERLQARLASTLGSFIKREMHPSEAFVELHCERLACHPDLAGRAPAVRASLQVLDDAIEAALAHCVQGVAADWTAADMAENTARPCTARIRRDEVRQLILQGDRLLSGEGQYKLAVESRCGAAARPADNVRALWHTFALHTRARAHSIRQPPPDGQASRSAERAKPSMRRA